MDSNRAADTSVVVGRNQQNGEIKVVTADGLASMTATDFSDNLGMILRESLEKYLRKIFGQDTA